MSHAPSQALTFHSTRFTYYDIESLGNTFTMCAYTPPALSAPTEHPTLSIFFLLDDDGVNAPFFGTPEEASAAASKVKEAVLDGNPSMPRDTEITLYNLRRGDGERGIKGNIALAQLIGMSDARMICDPRSRSTFDTKFRLICDTDAGYSPVEHPILVGYNSQNYDTVMLALYLMEAFAYPSPTNISRPTTAAAMRAYNDALFAIEGGYMPSYLYSHRTANSFRRAMLLSGRHLDAAKLNESQAFVALKRQLGMLGRQIKESEKLSHNTLITTMEDFCELVAYNVSDCVGLSQLMSHETYANAFDLKAGLLHQYTDTRFSDDSQTIVRSDRLTIDSTSAKFVARILAPNEPLDDIRAVSFDYPHPEVAKEQNVPVHNVLDLCVRFFEDTVAPNPQTHPDATPYQRAAHEQFMHVVRYYRSIEGKNFNASDRYQEVFGNLDESASSDPADRELTPQQLKAQHFHALQALTLSEVPKTPNNVPYFHADATPSSCFATFSTGGIHGVEAHRSRFEADQAAYTQLLIDLNDAQRTYPDARDFLAQAKEEHLHLRLPDGSVVSKSDVLRGSDPATVAYLKPRKGNPEHAALMERVQGAVPNPADLLATQRPESQKLSVTVTDPSTGESRLLDGKALLANTTAKNAAYREKPAQGRPELFRETKSGATALHDRYQYTSAGLVVHEDFSSYYPNLLRNMRAFYNPDLGEDRYANIFFEKERLGREMKNPQLSETERTMLSNLRNGTKLILNSASGAGDPSHSTPIQMNNRIISMRIIGQLFSWLIGQAQTLAGGRIISTNTDGLYSVVTGETEGSFSKEMNDRVLEEQSKVINVDIEPELMYLISKDSNSRLEIAAPRPGQTIAEAPTLGAGGGTLACYRGPRLDKSLAHAAAIDLALSEYLKRVVSLPVDDTGETGASGTGPAMRGEEALSDPFNPELGREMIDAIFAKDDDVKILRYFQTMVAGSRSSITYPFTTQPVEGETAEADADSETAVDESALVDPKPLQMINRVFFVKPGTPGSVHLLNAGAWKVPPATRERRERMNQSREYTVELLPILKHHGWVVDGRSAKNTGLTQLPVDQDITARRISGIDPTWHALVVNDDLHTLTKERRQALLASLDREVYASLLEHTFSKNWRNIPVGS